jgi:hypothetical protein
MVLTASGPSFEEESREADIKIHVQVVDFSVLYRGVDKFFQDTRE